MSTSTAIGEAFKHEENAKDPKLVFYVTELLQFVSALNSFVLGTSIH